MNRMYATIFDRADRRSSYWVAAASRARRSESWRLVKLGLLMVRDLALLLAIVIGALCAVSMLLPL